LDDSKESSSEYSLLDNRVRLATHRMTKGSFNTVSPEVKDCIKKCHHYKRVTQPHFRSLVTLVKERESTATVVMVLR